MNHPNTRYGNPQELVYYARGLTIKQIAASLHRSERTIQRWINGEEKMPFWAPELLRLRHYEYQNRLRTMNIRREKVRRTGESNVIRFPIEQTFIRSSVA